MVDETWLAIAIVALIVTNFAWLIWWFELDLQKYVLKLDVSHAEWRKRVAEREVKELRKKLKRFDKAFNKFQDAVCDDESEG